jgi:hypothetical protein
LAEKCVASAVLPRVDSDSDAAERGRWVHFYLELLACQSPDEALLQVPEKYHADCNAISLAGMPIGGDWEQELVVAYHVETGGARYAKAREDRRDGEVIGIIDAFRVDLDARSIEVWDFKTGERALGSPGASPQLLFYALALREIHFPDEEDVSITVGFWYTHNGLGDVSEDLGELEVDDFATRLYTLRANVEEAYLSYEAGHPVRTNIGDHCKWCPSFRYCPAQKAVFQSAPVLHSKTPLTKDQVKALLPKAMQVKQMAEEVLRVAKEFGEDILVDDGEYRLVTRENEYFSANRAKALLTEKEFDSIVKESITKASIKSGVGSNEGEILDKLRAGGAARTSKSKYFRFYKGKKDG